MKTRNIEIPPEYEKAFRLIEEEKCPFVLISGKAGTGKSTFIRLLEDRVWNLVKVAPTGIAALNIEGQTIHSFFKLPLKPITGFEDLKEPWGRAVEVFLSLKYLIIDEISMVRADILDGIDMYLQKARGRYGVPFGGVQVIAVGDVFQLPPVVAQGGEGEWIRHTYGNPYFFSSQIFKRLKEKGDAKMIEFTKVFRQKDDRFIRMLNMVRTGQGIDKVSQFLNRSTVGRQLNGDYITLCTTNALADQINKDRLNALPGEPGTFSGTVIGQFNAKTLPAPQELELKVGAQVMFVKNDVVDGYWVNGTLGHVVEVGTFSVQVAIPREGGDHIVTVCPVEWEQFQHDFNSRNKQITTKSVGSYTQLPLKLAWAATIHKAQGQTFDNVALNLGSGAFTTGQTYVALSRCRTIKGLSLTRPLLPTDVKVDDVLVKFMEEMVKGPPAPDACNSQDVPGDDPQQYPLEALDHILP
jgi:ATP-dependent DNA helicase PIF1